MNCPHCQSANTRESQKRTSLGYRIFRCRGCEVMFNERTGTVFNDLHCPTDIVMQLRAKRRGQAGKSWYVDETYVKIHGQLHYLYRAIDRAGNLVDTMLSATRDLAAAKAFFKQAVRTVGHKPERVTTDKHAAYPRAIRRILGRKVLHRTSQYLNNRIEQDHRALKQRYYPMRGFGSYAGATTFCSAFDEVRHYFRARSSTTNQSLSLSQQRQTFCQRWADLSAVWQTCGGYLSYPGHRKRDGCVCTSWIK
ncbi:MAG: IS6 family transposase [Aggregatilineales bacterium]